MATDGIYFNPTIATLTTESKNPFEELGTGLKNIGVLFAKDELLQQQRLEDKVKNQKDIFDIENLENDKKDKQWALDVLAGSDTKINDMFGKFGKPSDPNSFEYVDKIIDANTSKKEIDDTKSLYSIINSNPNNFDKNGKPKMDIISTILQAPETQTKYGRNVSSSVLDGINKIQGRGFYTPQTYESEAGGAYTVGANGKVLYKETPSQQHKVGSGSKFSEAINSGGLPKDEKKLLDGNKTVLTKRIIKEANPNERAGLLAKVNNAKSLTELGEISVGVTNLTPQKIKFTQIPSGEMKTLAGGAIGALNAFNYLVNNYNANFIGVYDDAVHPISKLMGFSDPKHSSYKMQNIALKSYSKQNQNLGSALTENEEALLNFTLPNISRSEKYYKQDLLTGLTQARADLAGKIETYKLAGYDVGELANNLKKFDATIAKAKKRFGLSQSPTKTLKQL
jgi:hypothetical protein